MIKDIPIPPEARMAATDELLRTGGDVVAAIRAALASWPGKRHDVMAGHVRQFLILPLKETPNAE